MKARVLCDFVNFKISNDGDLLVKYSMEEAMGALQRITDLYSSLDVAPIRRTLYTSGKATFGDFALTPKDLSEMFLASMMLSVHEASSSVIRSMMEADNATNRIMQRIG